jgi:mono/diheme cytochrome c family protein
MVLKLIVILSLAALTLSCSNQNGQANGNNSSLSGKELYENNCTQCHGGDGKLGNSGATDLSMSVLSDDESKNRIKNGLNAMPPMAELLGSEANIDSVVQYIKTLRTK